MKKKKNHQLSHRPPLFYTPKGVTSTKESPSHFPPSDLVPQVFLQEDWSGPVIKGYKCRKYLNDSLGVGLQSNLLLGRLQKEFRDNRTRGSTIGREPNLEAISFLYLSFGAGTCSVYCSNWDMAASPFVYPKTHIWLLICDPCLD